MKVIIGLCIWMFSSLITHSQNSIKIIVTDRGTRLPLPGASIIFPSLNKGMTTDTNGVAIFHDIRSGSFEVQVSYVGYAFFKKKITLPFNKTALEIELEQVTEENNSEVIVKATRTDRSLRNTPTRVEVIAGGEISENISMRPGEIRMLLNETTGIVAQQISAVSSTANIRIQELEGRYTQVLRDGFPLYSGLSEGLSLVQIAPLNLKQVEIIKGSSSTLYGGGAITGLINLVSKAPSEKKELSFLANGTSARGLDLSGFYSERYGKTGITLFGSRNSGAPYDPANIGLTAIPKFNRYTLAPRFFFYGKTTNVNAGVSYINENRLGGNMDYVEHGIPGYFEKNNSNRFTTQFELVQKIKETISIIFKNSYNHFKRSITLPSYQFEGLQQSSFSEISLNTGNEKSQWIAGMNFYTDDFNEVSHVTSVLRNYRDNTFGMFLQNTFSRSKLVSIESGVRADYTNPYGFIILPRLSCLFNFSENLSSRIGGGLGYKIPTIFTEESEQQHFKNILPLDKDSTMYEQSIGANGDITYRVTINKARLFINPLFFYTRINHPLILGPAPGNQQQFSNASGYTTSGGLDLSFRLTINEVKFFAGYSYTVAKNHFNGATSFYPLAPKQKLHFDLVYDLEGKLRVALEAYYTSRQQLSDSSTGKDYWLLGALIERTWKHFSIFINGEDLNNARQTKWDTIYTGTIDNPTFRDIYAPLEGIIINGGIKVRL